VTALFDFGGELAFPVSWAPLGFASELSTSEPNEAEVYRFVRKTSAPELASRARLHFGDDLTVAEALRTIH
jgi:hypothetical protein